MASVTLALPNMLDGTTVELSGLGFFKNGETSELNDHDVQVYIAQHADENGYAFRNGNGVTFHDLDEYLHPEEVIEQEESSFKLPGEVVHLVPGTTEEVDLDSMTLPQLHDYAVEVGTDIPEGVRLKKDVLAFLKDGTLPAEGEDSN